jgi:hypothetical protein
MDNGEWPSIREHRPATPTDLVLRDDRETLSPPGVSEKGRESPSAGLLPPGGRTKSARNLWGVLPAREAKCPHAPRSAGGPPTTPPGNSIVGLSRSEAAAKRQIRRPATNDREPRLSTWLELLDGGIKREEIGERARNVEQPTHVSPARG